MHHFHYEVRQTSEIRYQPPKNIPWNFFTCTCLFSDNTFIQFNLILVYEPKKSRISVLISTALTLFNSILNIDIAF